MDIKKLVFSTMATGNRSNCSCGPTPQGDRKFGDMDPFSPMYLTMNAVICLVVIVGNVLTIVAVLRFRSLKTVTNTFTLSLAIADLTVGIILPMCSVLNHTGVIKVEQTRQYMCYSCKTFTTTSAAASLYSLLAIAVDRFISIFWPLKYSIIMTQRRANFIVGLLWFYVLSSTSIMVWALHKPWAPQTYCSLNTIMPTSLYLGFYVLNIIVSLTITIYLYSRIFWEAHKQKRRITSFQHTVGRTERRNARVTRMMACVLGIFLLCWIPYTTLNVIHQIIKEQPVWLTVLYKTSISVLYANSCMNPFIYSWKNTTFRRAFHRLLHCSDPEEAEESQFAKNSRTNNPSNVQSSETPL